MDPRVRARTNEFTLLAFLATVVMLFAAFTSAYLIRRSGTDWQQLTLPGIMWVNTALLLASSFTIEFARRTQASLWLMTTTVLGVLFLGGQYLAWQAMANAGMFLPTQPHSSFFYMLTAVHGVHLLGGIVALTWAMRRKSSIGLCATYWHFVDGVWIYLFIMLSVL